MLDLDARVDLHEVEVVAVDVVEEFDRARVAIADRGQEIDRRPVQARARRFRHRDGRRLLDHLLVAALHRAIPLAEMQHAAVAEAHDLHLDVTRALDIAFEIERSVAEGFLRFDRGALKAFGERFGVARDDHAAAPAARRGFGDHRKADLLREGDGFGGARELAAARRHRDARGFRKAPRGELVADSFDRVGRRADEGDPVLLAEPREGRAFGQKAIAGMQSVASRRLGRMHDQTGVEIGGARRRRAERHDPVGFSRGETVAVGGGDGKHRLEAEALRRADDAERDLSAIGDEDPTQAHVRRRVR